MNATAIVGGKVVRFRLPDSLAKSHHRNAERSMTEADAIAFVETKRRETALRRAKPYLEGHS